MTKTQKRNARARRAHATCRAMGPNSLHLSFKCTFWDSVAENHHFPSSEVWKEIRKGSAGHRVLRSSLSTLDIPTFTCTFRLGSEDPSQYLGELKGVLNGIIKTIHNCPVNPPNYPLLFVDRKVRLECTGRFGSMDPWRLKWRGVDVETVVADVIAAVGTQDPFQNLATS